LKRKPFVLESVRITLFCLVITLLFSLFGATNETILIVFNMAVMSAAATFVPQRKPTSFIVTGSSTMVLAIVVGGILGFYFPLAAKIVGIILAGLAFYLPKRKAAANIFVTSVVMFFVFSSIPFDLSHAIQYLLSGIAVVVLFTVFHWICESKFYPNQIADLSMPSNNRPSIMAIAVISLAVGWVCSYFLKIYTDIDHLYWIPLTILVIIQGSQGRTIKTSLIRIAVNTAGALFVVILFTYLMPSVFWVDLAVLTVFLFLIFALGYSYVFRTLFIELFVLGFTHLLGKYENVIAYDRIFLTLVGGGLVISSSLLVASINNSKKNQSL
jgi:hypothetical protein